MEALPDDLVNTILLIGVSTARLSHQDICCFSITCRRFFFLSSDAVIWSSIVSRDYPDFICYAQSGCPKSLYKIRFERDKPRRLMERQQQVILVENKILDCRARLSLLELRIQNEAVKLGTIQKELADMEQIRRTSVVFNLWRPQMVGGSQMLLVEQCAIPMESTLNGLKMDISVSSMQITVLENNIAFQKQSLIESKKALELLKYNPLQGYNLGAESKDNYVKRKKAKLHP